jgi:hypothetical protein
MAGIGGKSEENATDKAEAIECFRQRAVQSMKCSWKGKLILEMKESVIFHCSMFFFYCVLSSF